LSLSSHLDCRAAEQGDAEAHTNLGIMYENGQGVPQDYAAAVNWYRWAAQQGLARAQINLGVMYDKGRGVPQDFVVAHMWFNLAATSGDKVAVEHRDKAAARMTQAASNFSDTTRLFIRNSGSSYSFTCGSVDKPDPDANGKGGLFRSGSLRCHPECVLAVRNENEKTVTMGHLLNAAGVSLPPRPHRI
jgi:hypothetical protein